MIIYDDLRPVPLFKPYFEASGIRHMNHFRSVLAEVINKQRVRKYIPDSYIYSNPVCTDDVIIVFDTHTTYKYLNWLCEMCPNKRIILWFWNPALRYNSFARANERVEKWSYSKRDAQEWGMHYNSQFFFDCFAEEATATIGTKPNQPPRALFIGREKGRTEKLERLKSEIEEAGMLADIRLIPLPKGKHMRSYREKLIPYREIIDAVKTSDVLIDYYADPAAGLSLRAMEALFFEKKLITNRSLMRDEDFYDSHNIYILGEENRSLKEFIKEPYSPPNPIVRNRYLLSNWLKRFQNEDPNQ